MPTAVPLGRALITSALLFFCAPVFACAPERIDEVVDVSWVYDGDTLRLKDGRKLRLIGINTPEMGDDENPDEPHAEAATQALRMIIDATGRQIRIRHGADRKDRYGRLLAHAFTMDGRSINAHILDKGLGAAITIAPNDWNADCYFRHEQAARQAGKGIWKDDSMGPTDSARIPQGQTGFHIVSGRVERIGESRRSSWINLKGGVALRIDHSDKAEFPKPDFEDLMGRWVEARGWIYVHKGQPRMRISHPRSMKIIED